MKFTAPSGIDAFLFGVVITLAVMESWAAWIACSIGWLALAIGRHLREQEVE